MSFKDYLDALTSLFGGRRGIKVVFRPFIVKNVVNSLTKTINKSLKNIVKGKEKGVISDDDIDKFITLLRKQLELVKSLETRKRNPFEMYSIVFEFEIKLS